MNNNYRDKNRQNLSSLGRTRNSGEDLANKLKVKRAKSKNIHRTAIGLTALVIFCAAIFLNNSSVSTADVTNVKENGIGKGMKAGTVLVAADDLGLQAKDFNVEMKSNVKTGRLLIWDYAAEDGDVVTVKADGKVIAENVGILHEPFSLDIPIPSVVEVVGIKDGGGGITYGVKIPGAVGNSVFFNAAPIGSANKYTITGPVK
ncbi:hypothetical protein [Paenibacillus radicis (ex Gao et al. 2016)]|uniref:Uncharacterized protein n=1 Tax=Paenibacillus radicis (ex Gao et al. 2016) TaxID=1737354 RepID=A0A917GY60_9BACL|nr:hypothetical protein [Paenibacillus radicis (ex Gao et al. 2016)]GGG61633.1 hypothetical protein GCM10010918_13980 [Paenibacillus radicis (ex Gao et al. 2016)]